MYRAVAALVFLALPVGSLVSPARVSAGQPSATIEQQRALFVAAYREAEKGDWGPAATARATLADYPLWPDLREAWLRATIRDAEPVEIEEFLERHRHLRTADRLRDRWIYELARRQDWRRFLATYEEHYAGAGITRLDCIAADARYLADPGYRYGEETVTSLWLAGRSQPEECDPVFERLQSQGLLTTARYRERFRLAVAAREFRLARYLARDLDESARREARAWLAMQQDPAAELIGSDPATADAAGIERMLWGIRSVAREDPAYAAMLWQRLAPVLPISGEEHRETAGYIAIRAALRRDPAAPGLLKSLPAQTAGPDVLAWRTRNAMLRGDWDDVVAAIDGMTPEMRAEEIWRYWRARALAATGHSAAAEQVYAALATERSYYGFMAADALGRPYAFGHAAIEIDEAMIDALASDSAIRRAGELFRVGLESRGRSEWNEAIAGFDVQRLKQAAVLAHRWGWHSRAIAAAAKVGHYDDLHLRYPLAWREYFEDSAAAANIREAWALGIARSESLFMADVRSSAGAVGVMQLMPATGRSTAREERLPWRGYATLTDPLANIRLGTRYLSRVFERFSANPVLATAAYNAGPHRVEAWLPETGTVPADIWIETIPFSETRAYVKRVLTADSIFSWRLTGREIRLSALHPPIRASAERLALADMAAAAP